MKLPRRNPTQAAPGTYDRFQIWNVPSSVWAYGLLRAIAFGLPLTSETGGLGLNVLVVLVLYVPLIRGSRLAWSTLLVLDILTLVLLIITQQTTQAPWLVHICTAGAIVALLVPSTRAYVVGRSAARARRR